MTTWQVLEFTPDQLRQKWPAILQHHLHKAFVAAGRPNNVVVFSPRDRSTGSRFYFSPKAAEMLAKIEGDWRLQPCVVPARGSVAGVVGNPDVLRLLTEALD